MPTLNKPKKHVNYQKQGRNKGAAEIYNSKEWKNLRLAYVMEHPLCEMCLEEGITKPTEEVHHKVPILKGKDKLEMMEYALNSSNLISLCKEHHHFIHNNNIKL